MATTTNGKRAADEAALVPPQNLDAEESVLGAMLMSPHAITAVSDIVRPEHFYRGSHAKIFQAALDLDAKGEPVDAITLVNFLDERGELADAGGKVRIHELVALTPASSNAGHYAEIVREMSQLRALIAAGLELQRLGWERPGDTPDLLVQAEQIVSQAVASGAAGDLNPATEGLDAMLTRIGLAVESGKPIFGLKSGFPDLDACTTGFYPGQLVVIAARPGFGKSVLGANIAQNVATLGKSAGIFSLEMSREELQLRLLARLTGLDSRRIRSGSVTPEEFAKVKKAAETLREQPLYIEDSAIVNTTEIRARARRMKKKVGLDILVVDYLQLMAAEGSAQQRNEQVAQMSRSLKLLAKELEVPVIAISQLNRNTEQREDRRPVLSDLRDSGAVEQDADIVLFIYREEMYKKVDAEKASSAEIIVAKNRMGAVDTIRLLFHARRQAFLSPAKE